MSSLPSQEDFEAAVTVAKANHTEPNGAWEIHVYGMATLPNGDQTLADSIHADHPVEFYDLSVRWYVGDDVEDIIEFSDLTQNEAQYLSSVLEDSFDTATQYI